MRALTRSPPSAAAWTQRKHSAPMSTTLQQPSRPLLTHTQPGSAKDLGLSTPLPEGPTHRICALRKRYPSDPSDLILPSWMSDQPRLKCQPKSKNEPPTSTVEPKVEPAEHEIQPVELEIQTLKPENLLTEMEIQPAEPMIPAVTAEIPSFMRLSLAALLSEALTIGQRPNILQVSIREAVFGVNNMFTYKGTI